MSSKTQAYFSLDEIDYILTNPYYLQANGWVEHLNGALLQIPENLSTDNQKLWYKHLPTILMIIRAYINKNIKFSPFDIVYRLNLR